MNPAKRNTLFLLTILALSVGCASDGFDSGPQSLRSGEHGHGEPGFYPMDGGTEDAGEDAPDSSDGGEECVGVTPGSEKTDLTSHQTSPGAEGEVRLDLGLDIPSLWATQTTADLSLSTIQAATVFHQLYGDEVPFTFDPQGTIADRFNHNVLTDSAFSRWSLEADGPLFGGQSLECETVLQDATNEYLMTCRGAMTQALKSYYLGEDVISNQLGTNRYPQSASFTAGVLAFNIDASIRYDLQGNVLERPDVKLRGIPDFATSDITYRAELDVRNVPGPGCQFFLGAYHTDYEDAEDATSFRLGVRLFSR